MPKVDMKAIIKNFDKDELKGLISISQEVLIRKRGKGKKDKKKRGISNEQLCIETGIDRKGNIIMGAVCNGRITLMK